MDFLILSLAGEAAAGIDHDALNERHWSYMDGFADRMRARGPTFDRARDTWTGSMHIVDLPGPDAAREFVADEPYHRAGLFTEHRVWRFEDLLGRTMWDYDGPADQPRFLVLGLGAAHLDLPGDRVIVRGRLRDLDADRPVGVLLAVQTASRAELDTMLGRADLEVRDWEFGGRR
jgi:uncharacterized protein YciI